jgi:transposase
MVREAIEQASREELIELALSTHAVAEQEKTRAEQEKARRVEAERQLAWLRKQLFGTKSEKRPGPIAEVVQLSLGQAMQGEARSVEKTLTVKAHARVISKTPEPKNEPALRFDDSVPKTRRVILPPEVAGLDESEYEVMGERVTQRLVQIPAAYRIDEIVRPVVKLKGENRIVAAPAELGVLERCLADVSLLVGLLLDKFRFHLPLYRQHQRMQAAGIHLARSTLTDWVHRSIDLLRPIYDAQLASILTSRVLAMDETPIKAGRSGPGKMKQGYYWPVFGDQNELAFPFATSRGHQHAVDILGKYCGTLISDDYGAYEAYAAKRDEVTRASCWAHVRRKFVEAEGVEPERVARALEWIRSIYRIEEEIREEKLDGEAKLARRSTESRPLVEALFGWLKQELVASALLPTNPFTEAARHAIKLQAPLEVFLSDPAVPIDTNHLERGLRPIPMGRKNWLFCWTEVGAEKVGIIQSLITTCVLQGVDPYTYLVDVLQRVEIHPQRDITDLTPRLWREKFAKQAMPSPALAI